MDKRNINGEKWTKELERLIDKSNIFVVMLNNDYKDSEVCMEELKRAISKKENNESYKILPINIDISSPDRIPGPIEDREFQIYPDKNEPILYMKNEGEYKNWIPKQSMLSKIAENVLYGYIEKIYKIKNNFSSPSTPSTIFIIIRNRNEIVTKIEKLTDPGGDYGRTLERITEPENDILGIFALERIWGNSKPEFKRFSEHLNLLDNLKLQAELKKILSAADSQGWFKKGGHFKDPYLGVGIAADHIVRWFEKERQLGKDFLLWALDNLDQLNDERQSVVKSIIDWWGNNACTLINEWRESCYQKCTATWNKDDKIQSITCLTICDYFLRDLKLKDNEDEAPSINWAYTLGLTELLPDIFEKLGEKRMEIIQRHLDRLESGSAATRLAIWLKHKIEDGSIEGSPTGERGLAIRCSKQDVKEKDLELMQNSPLSQDLWLNLLEPPLNPKHIDMLIHLIETSQTATRKNYLLTFGAKHLANSSDLLGVWVKLGDMQIDWINKLSGEELLHENFEKFKKKINREREVVLTEIEKKSRKLLNVRFKKALENKNAVHQVSEGD